MLTNFIKALGTSITARDGVIPDLPVGKVVDVIINSNNGHLEGLWVKASDGMKILLMSDILHWNEMEFLIQDESDLSSPEGLPKLTKILDNEVRVLGTTVVGKFTKKRYGKVSNFTFDTISPHILSLRIKSGWWIFGTSRHIPRSKISKFSEEAIYINDQGIKIEKKEEKKEVKKPVIEG